MCGEMALQGVRQGCEHKGSADTAGTQCVADRQERVMPKLRRHHATEAARANVCPSLAHHTASHGMCGEMALQKVCRSVAQRLEREGKADAAGKQCVVDRQERVMPKLRRHHAMHAPQVNVCSSLAHNTALHRCDAVLLKGSRARRERRRRWYGVHGRPPGACDASAVSSPCHREARSVSEVACGSRTD